MRKFSKITENAHLEDTKPEEIIRLTWECEFGSSIPTTAQKLEFYHQLRDAGFEGELIMSVIKFKGLI